MRRSIFYFTFQSNQFEGNMKSKSFSIVQSIKLYGFDVKAIVAKKVVCNILWKHSQKKRNVIIEILSCNFDGHNFPKWILPQDLTSNIFELNEAKTEGKRKV